MKKRKLPLSKAYKLIETGPVMLLATRMNSASNVMTLAWHTMMDFDPPLVGIVVSETNHSFKALLKTKVCTLNIPTLKEAKAVVGAGHTSGSDTDKFARFSIATSPARQVDAPLLDDCFASFECKVVDTRMAKRYNFLVLEVVQAWADPACTDPKTLHHRGGDAFMVAGKTRSLPVKAK